MKLFRQLFRFAIIPFWLLGGILIIWLPLLFSIIDMGRHGGLRNSARVNFRIWWMILRGDMP